MKKFIPALILGIVMSAALRADPVDTEVTSVEASRLKFTLDGWVAAKEKTLQGLRAELLTLEGPARDEMLRRIRRETDQFEFLKKEKEVVVALADASKQPIVGVILNGGIDAGLKVPLWGGSIGPGAQVGAGGFLTWTKGQGAAKYVPNLSSALLYGYNLTFRKGLPAGWMKFASMQTFGGIGLIFPHNRTDGSAHILRRSDFEGWYIGMAGESSFTNIPVLRNLRMGIGVYSMVDQGAVSDAFNVQNVSIKKTLSEKASALWHNVVNGVENLGNDALVGKATLVFISPEIGSYDGSVEGQIEALKLKF